MYVYLRSIGEDWNGNARSDRGGEPFAAGNRDIANARPRVEQLHDCPRTTDIRTHGESSRDERPAQIGPRIAAAGRPVRGHVRIERIRWRAARSGPGCP